MHDDGRSRAGAAGVEGLAVQIFQRRDAGVLGDEDLNGGGFVVPQNAEVGEGITVEGGAGTGVALVVGIGDGVGDGNLTNTQLTGVGHVAAGFGDGDVQLRELAQHFAQRDAVGEQTGACGNSREGQVTGFDLFFCGGGFTVAGGCFCGGSGAGAAGSHTNDHGDGQQNG